MTGPVLVIPYRATATETVVENGKSVTRTNEVTRELTLAPEAVELSTDVGPKSRKRSIYEAVVYDAHVSGQGALRLSAGPRPDRRRALADGLDAAPSCASASAIRAGSAPIRSVAVGGKPLRLQPGGGSSGGRGFFAWVDASGLAAQPIAVDFAYDFRGNASLSLAPAGRRHAVDGAFVLAEPELRRRFPARQRATSATRASTPTTASAISRSADRWSAPATPARCEPAAPIRDARCDYR